jgi:hypothetical protein
MARKYITWTMNAVWALKYCDRFSHQKILIEFVKAMEDAGEDSTGNAKYLELQDLPRSLGLLQKIRNSISSIISSSPDISSGPDTPSIQLQAPEDLVYYTLLPCGYIVFWKWYNNEKRIEVVAEIWEKEKIPSVDRLNKLIQERSINSFIQKIS